MQQIGIAISTKNRREVAEKTIAEIRKFAPKGSKVVIVDDASDIPYPNADFRFETTAGIAKVKNKCLALLEDCEHIFLFDDDIFPVVKDWHLPYINSGYNHLMYIFDTFASGNPTGNRKSADKDGISIYHHPCGCMIYYKKICLDTVGGMDEGYGIWGFEHPDHSTRIYNAGLTPHKFMDVTGSDKLFFSYDKEQTIERSVPASIRTKHTKVNRPKYDRLGKSAHYIPYKPEKNIILTSFFTSVIDTQRGVNWEAKLSEVDTLIKSCIKHNCKLVILHDCFNEPNTDHVEFVRVETSINPYFQRWVSYLEYLKSNRFGIVWMVDATDVEVLKNPFELPPSDGIFVGWERGVVGCKWMFDHHKSAFTQSFLSKFRNRQIYNAGVIGGRYQQAISFLEKLCSKIDQCIEDKTDMPLFNYTVYNHFLRGLKSGINVTTEFKKFDYRNKVSLFRHK